MEECEYGLTRGTCFTARRLDVVAVAGLLWIYFVVCIGCGGIFLVFFFFVFLERTRPTARTRTPCLVYLSTSNEAYCGIKGSVTVNKTGSRTDLTDSMV